MFEQILETSFITDREKTETELELGNSLSSELTCMLTLNSEQKSDEDTKAQVIHKTGVLSSV